MEKELRQKIEAEYKKKMDAEAKAKADALEKVQKEAEEKLKREQKARLAAIEKEIESKNSIQIDVSLNVTSILSPMNFLKSQIIDRLLRFNPN